MRLYWCPEVDIAEPRRRRVDRLLRTVLAPLLACDPDAVLFARETKGRPFVDQPGAPDFNLSDTKGGSVIAVCRHGRVGVDLERLDRRPPVARLAARWFTADEANALARLEEESARQSFLHLWTAKEASCKATGTGIYGRLASWQFAVDEARPRCLVAPVEAGAMSDWSFQRHRPVASHTVAVALHRFAPASVTTFTLADG